jgi:YggT family protein
MVGVFLTALLSMVLDFWLLSEVSFSAILLLTVFRVLQWVLYGLMALLVLEAIFSWVNPHAPLAPFIRALNEPLLSPFRKVLPALGGLDFSPLLVLILLQILSRVLNELMPRLLML